jgi:hypothetical protein
MKLDVGLWVTDLSWTLVSGRKPCRGSSINARGSLRPMTSYPGES